jgi:hypothetical protein
VRTRVLGVGGLLACLVVAAVSAGASAGVVHPLSGTFGAFASPGAVAVDQVSGDVLVLDRGTNQVLRFDAAGNPINFSALGSNVLDGSATPQGSFAFDGSPGAAQLAVDNSGGPADGDIYVTNSFFNVVDVFANDGHYLGELTSSPNTGGFGETCGVAVDTTGTVYVAETNGWVHRYGALSNPVADADFSSEFFAGACNVAVDSGGNVYAAQLFSVVNKYSPAGDFQYTVDPNASNGVAVDPATDNVYVAEGGQVAQYDASSAVGAVLLGTSGNGQVGSPAGVAARGSTNQVYVSDASANNVAIFGAGVLTPDATTGAASSVTDTAATLNGTVNPQGQATTWQFQWGTDTGYGQTAPASPGDAGSGSSDVSVSADLTGLSAGTTYHYRLVAVGTNGTTYGADQTFTTQGPPVVDSESADPVGKTTATLQAQINPFGLDTTYHFDYGLDTSYGTSTPDAVISAAQGDQTASADISGLTPNTTYHFRVVASNALGGPVDGPDQTFTTVAVLNIDREYVTALSPSAATLNADIDPLGDPTTYHFELGTTTAYGTNAPTTDATVGSGVGDVTVSQPLSGLIADTVYHYRVVATNPVGTIQGPDHTFRTRALEGTAADSCPNAGIRASEHASFLPDCRAYEMVSPAEKNGGDVSASPSRTRAAVSGNAVQFVSMTGFGEVHGSNSVATEYVSTRSSSGWATHGITPPQQPPAFPAWRNRYQGDFSDDLSTGIYFALSPVTNEDPNVAQLRNLYVRRDLLRTGPGAYQLLTGCTGCTSPLAPPPPAQILEDPALAGNTADFRHVIFESPVDLTPAATGNGNKLYESVDGHVRLAGILPDGTPAQESAAGLGALNVDGLGTSQYTPNTISTDGTRIIFTAGPFTDPTTLGLKVFGRIGDLYMRINGSSTIKLNVSERSTADPNGPQPAMYGGASADDSKVFFISSELLTDDATPGGGLNLYMYDLNAPAGHHLTLVTHDNNPTDDFTGTYRAEYVVGTSADGSYVYFWGTNGLLPGQGTGANKTELLYVWHNGELRFIGSDGTLNQDPVNWGELGTVNAHIPRLTRVSPDGRQVVFATKSPETAQSVGYDNRSASCGQGACIEVYLYSSDTDRLTCVSCDPGGAQPGGDAGFATNSEDTTVLTSTRHLTHVLSDDGQRVFFDTPDPLVARDSNGKRDVYEYDAATGRVSLISTGRSSSDSFFVEATPNGSDVYFTTRQQLAGIDTDEGVDLYDARIDGGIADQNPPVQVPCAGVACRPAPSSAPPPITVLGGVSFQGSPTGARPVTARMRVVRKAVRGSVLVLAVRVPRAGRIEIRGGSIRSVSRSVSHAGTYRMRFRLTPRARHLLRHRRALRIRVRVSYRAAGGPLSNVVVPLRVKA